MADEVMGLQGSFTVDTSSLDSAAAKIASVSDNIVNSLRKVKSAADATRSSGPGGDGVLPLAKLQFDAIKFKDAADKGASGATNLAGRLMVLGQIADDAQYGFRAIVNQIPMAVAAFGGSMGLAGGLALAGVAVNQLLMHWNNLTQALGSPVALTAAQQMEELGKKTSKTADEMERLSRYQREQKTITDQSARRPGKEGDITKQVAEQIGEFPGGADELRTRLRRRLLEQMPKITDEEIAKETGEDSAMAAFGKHQGTDVAGARRAAIARIEQRRRERAIESANNMLANAETGPGQLGQNARRRIGELLPGEEGEMFRDPEKAARDRQQRAWEAQGARYSREFDKRKREKDEEYRQGLIESAKDDAEENDKNWLSQMNKKIDRSERLTQGERSELKKLNPDMLEKNDDMERKEVKEEEQLKDQAGDLSWRLRGLLMKGAPQSNSFSDLNSYEGSIRAKSGEDQLRKLNDIHETLEKIDENTAKQQKVAERIAR
jgi:hypothetical protein